MNDEAHFTAKQIEVVNGFVEQVIADLEGEHGA